MAIVISAPRGEKLRLEALVDTEMFADLAGVQPNTIHAYRKVRRVRPTNGESGKPRTEYNVPEPVAYVGGVPVWTRAQVYAWLDSRPGQGSRSDRLRA